MRDFFLHKVSTPCRENEMVSSGSLLRFGYGLFHGLEHPNNFSHRISLL